MDNFGAREQTRLWLMIETTQGVWNLKDILGATHRTAALIAGTNDLCADMHGSPESYRLGLVMALSTIVTGARAAKKLVFDGVYNHFNDAAGFEAECAQGRLLGFDGKTLIHPSQIESANRVFSPTAAEVARAQKISTAFEAVRAEKKSVAVVDGKMIEELHYKAAQMLLATHAAITAA